MDGVALSVPSQLISAKGNHATMVALVNRVPDGFDVPALKDSADQIVG